MREGTEGRGEREGEKAKKKRIIEVVKMACQVNMVAARASQLGFPVPGCGHRAQW